MEGRRSTGPGGTGARGRASRAGARIRASAAHEPSYPVFLRGRAGDRLRVTPRPETSPGWTWCADAAGVASWVPDEFIDVGGGEAVLKRDYDATELRVAAGDALEVLERVAGWALCRRADGRVGWVPDACVARPAGDQPGET